METASTETANGVRQSPHAAAQAKYRAKHAESEREKAKLRMRRVREARKRPPSEERNSQGETYSEFIARERAEYRSSPDFVDFREFCNKVMSVTLRAEFNEPEEWEELKVFVSGNPCLEDLPPVNEDYVEYLFRRQERFPEWREELADYRDIVAENTPEELDRLNVEARAKLSNKFTILARGGFYVKESGSKTIEFETKNASAATLIYGVYRGAEDGKGDLSSCGIGGHAEVEVGPILRPPAKSYRYPGPQEAQPVDNPAPPHPPVSSGEGVVSHAPVSSYDVWPDQTWLVAATWLPLKTARTNPRRGGRPARQGDGATQKDTLWRGVAALDKKISIRRVSRRKRADEVARSGWGGDIGYTVWKAFLMSLSSFHHSHYRGAVDDDWIPDTMNADHDPRFWCLPMVHDSPSENRSHGSGYPMYLVTNGRKLGVWHNWTVAQTMVKKYSGNTYRGHHTIQGCIKEWQLHCASGAHPHPVDPALALPEPRFPSPSPSAGVSTYSDSVSSTGSSVTATTWADVPVEAEYLALWEGENCVHEPVKRSRREEGNLPILCCDDYDEAQAFGEGVH
ncbi:hypothetical protein C8F04DRAFT_1201434 [Mycena alexandri]|uniref:Ribonuclease H1 N-terminal domain-containing protein n=1 Tax=Mycena alexandri TaxID=1745969 RepID=A0AAD6WKD8_9AGAR|nr:hypothetical protein C8F04DRAFT_1201434 [Mycena alexandri]